MLEGWSEYYLLTGTAAASLIGLLFVVITLTTGRRRSTVLLGASLYMSPVLLHLAFVLVLSAAALAPIPTQRGFGLVLLAIALLGLGASVRVIVGLRKLSDPTPHWSDLWWYGAGPAVIYLTLAAASIAIHLSSHSGILALAAGTIALLLISIHNAWDLVIWTAPRPDE